MNDQDARRAVHTAIRTVAPDLAEEDLAEEARLRQDLELDSLDFLALVETLLRDTGVSIPEDSYARVATVGGLVAFVAENG